MEERAVGEASEHVVERLVLVRENLFPQRTRGSSDDAEQDEIQDEQCDGECKIEAVGGVRDLGTDRSIGERQLEGRDGESGPLEPQGDEDVEAASIGTPLDYFRRGDPAQRLLSQALLTAFVHGDVRVPVLVDEVEGVVEDPDAGEALTEDAIGLDGMVEHLFVPAAETSEIYRREAWLEPERRHELGAPLVRVDNALLHEVTQELAQYETDQQDGYRADQPEPRHQVELLH